MRYEELRNYGLTEKQKAVRESAKKFTEKGILPVINEYEVKGRYPLDLIKKIGQLAIWGQYSRRVRRGWDGLRQLRLHMRGDRLWVLSPHPSTFITLWLGPDYFVLGQRIRNGNISSPCQGRKASLGVFF